MTFPVIRTWLGIGAVVVSGAVVASVTTSTGGGRSPPVLGQRGAHPNGFGLVAYRSCPDLLAGLRHAAEAFTDPFLAPMVSIEGGAGVDVKKAASPAASAQSFTANDYSSTNDYVAGADEPDVGLAHLVKTGLRSNAEWDRHAFLYWPRTGTAVLPVNSFPDGRLPASALVLNVGDSGLTVWGTITQSTHPTTSTKAESPDRWSSEMTCGPCPTPA